MKKNVLIIDDNLVNRQLLSTYAKRVDIINDVYVADDGDVGLQVLSEHDDIDLILLDLYMPKMTGFEVLETLKNQNSEIPVIVLSTDTEQSKIVLELGATFFLSKPIKVNSLIEAVEKIFK